MSSKVSGFSRLFRENKKNFKLNLEKFPPTHQNNKIVKFKNEIQRYKNNKFKLKLHLCHIKI